MKKAIVQIKNLSKEIKGKKIVSDLSFDIFEGEVFGFLGPNGAGKTTTIRMMVGLMNISEGDVVINGHSIKSNFEDAIKNVGAIVENPELYKFLSGYDNLLQYARMDKNVSKEKIDEVVELVGLTGAIRQKVKTYSLGMRQRLGLAQCLLHDPKVLILDEPTNGLDPAGIREMRDHLQLLTKKKGMAIIVSSHLLAEMEMMCDRIGIIQQGKLVDVQAVTELTTEDVQTYSIEVNNNETALKVLSKHNVQLVDGEIHIELTREDVPNVIELLVENHIRVYGFKANAKTLEDRFLEITNV
ncbi:bacitracin ABC transporter ATP-binding protein [Bacillus sp. AFS077874]|uniref:ABC transporter ATP-binding protein n=1 Tax=unclassified Bacillus (in: firmicutes) TaxID=185979 RepID=UPI000BEB4549|nr:MULTISPECIES: ABC transporter ATP-binding protein [unclassified Bacillus (in: firmicutes)]PEC51080.1 bacitracin ABC transporter ATP-binding protein [Bacillus sp. AFS096315]PFM81247.1 bacitracin ABC transporter ATP-binding protein [Bacillus sp. AFS077874]